MMVFKINLHNISVVLKTFRIPLLNKQFVSMIFNY